MKLYSHLPPSCFKYSPFELLYNGVNIKNLSTLSLGRLINYFQFGLKIQSLAYNVDDSYTGASSSIDLLTNEYMKKVEHLKPLTNEYHTIQLNHDYQYDGHLVSICLN